MSVHSRQIIGNGGGADAVSAPPAASCSPADTGGVERAAGTYGKPGTAEADPFGHFQETLARLEAEGVANVDGYVLFGSHVDALALFQACRGEGLQARISPTPRDARSSCGVALLIPCRLAEKIYRLSLDKGIPMESMVALPRQIDAHRDRYC